MAARLSAMITAQAATPAASQGWVRPSSAAANSATNDTLQAGTVQQALGAASTQRRPHTAASLGRHLHLHSSLLPSRPCTDPQCPPAAVARGEGEVIHSHHHREVGRQVVHGAAAPHRRLERADLAGSGAGRAFKGGDQAAWRQRWQHKGVAAPPRQTHPLSKPSTASGAHQREVKRPGGQEVEPHAARGRLGARRQQHAQRPGQPHQAVAAELHQAPQLARHGGAAAVERVGQPCVKGLLLVLGRGEVEVGRAGQAAVPGSGGGCTCSASMGPNRRLLLWRPPRFLGEAPMAGRGWGEGAVSRRQTLVRTSRRSGGGLVVRGRSVDDWSIAECS